MLCHLPAYPHPRLIFCNISEIVELGGPGDVAGNTEGQDSLMDEEEDSGGITAEDIYQAAYLENQQQHQQKLLRQQQQQQLAPRPVSYTHLTLPTILLV